MDVPDRVVATPGAVTLIRALRTQHGPLMFHQSGGCCDGSAPMCYPRGEFKAGHSDLFLGDLDGEPFFIGAKQYDVWGHTQLIVDVVEGRGAGFSLEAPTGMRFLAKARVFTPAERDLLATRRLLHGDEVELALVTAES